MGSAASNPNNFSFKSVGAEYVDNTSTCTALLEETPAVPEATTVTVYLFNPIELKLILVLPDKATTSVPLKHISYEPKIYIDPSDSVYDFPSKPFFIVGILGIVPSKSLPAATMAKVVDHISKVYPDHLIIFNYAPHQREEATIIYSLCKNKEAIDLNLYESDLSKFLMLLSKSSALISNEGVSVHMAKALNVPTFTIYSPFITKEHWNSFENLPIHQSIHLAEKRPDLYKNADRKRLKEIEKNPGLYYSELTSDMIWSNLKSYLKNLINT